MKVFALVSSLAPLAGQASAHGYLSQPAATFKDGVADTNCSAILAPDIDPAFRGSDWNGSPIDNAADFADAFPNTSFGSLRDMIDSVMIDCGNTALTNQRVDVGSLHSMKWQDDDTHRGFTDSHHGPCEAWIDDERVFHSTDCRAYYTGYPAEIPIDFSVCRGDCTFAFYWLALQSPEWEAHKQCASIVNSDERGTSRRLGILTQYFMAGLDSLFGGKRSEENQSKQFSSGMSAGLGGLSSLVGLRR